MKEIDELRAMIARLIGECNFNAGCDSERLCGVKVECFEAGSCEECTRSAAQTYFDMLDAIDARLRELEPEPDSMERIKADARKDYVRYWGCRGYDCDMCNANIGGKTPTELYGLGDCEDAIRLDLIARAEKLLGGE